MRRVVLESPYQGDVKANIEYARRCLRDSLDRGECPIASHLLYTQLLRDEHDDEPEQRQIGIAAGHEWIRVADAVVAYTDRGVSPGMRLGLNEAQRLGVPVEWRKLEEGK